MYERFTDAARVALQFANQEAQRLHHEYIGTEHILLGLVKLGSGVAVKVLEILDIDLRKIRLQVEKIVQAGPDMVTLSKLPQTPRAKKVIEYSIEEARNLNHNYVGTEHLLLGLLRVEEGVAAQLLMNLGLKLEGLREEILNLLGGSARGLATARRSPGVGVYGLPAEEFPAEIGQGLQELDSRIESLNQGKEAAVAEGDFEKAAHLRDQANRLKSERRTMVLEWRRRRLPEPSWLSWNGGTVANMARVIDEERRWGDLPLLADALEKAGCTDREILNHCRDPVEHVAGCWVVALLLGKR